VREGVQLLAACYGVRPAKRVIGVGRFASGLPDLASNKKHLKGSASEVLLDTGVIVALLDRSERCHARCVTTMQGLDRPLATCEAVIAESCYLLRELPGAAATVLENVEGGVFQIPFQLSRVRGFRPGIDRRDYGRSK
jgi:hypothetical protein